MSLSFYLLLVPTIAYLLAAASYGFHRNWPMAVVYFGYFMANCGLLALDRIAKG
jgi:hypothetical protein